MRTLKILLIIGLLFAENSFGQTLSSVSTDREIYNFLNWMTRTERKFREEPFLTCKRVDCNILPWDTANFIAKDTSMFRKYPLLSIEANYLFQRKSGSDSIFKPTDRAFLFQQFIAIKDSVWHDSFSNSKLFKKKKQRRPNRYFYSVPLFSVDKKYVVIRREYLCGDLCAYGGFYICKKVGERKWKYVTSVNTWMS
jgi:hypothetical protein